MSLFTDSEYAVNHVRTSCVANITFLYKCGESYLYRMAVIGKRIPLLESAFLFSYAVSALVSSGIQSVHYVLPG